MRNLTEVPRRYEELTWKDFDEINLKEHLNIQELRGK